MQRSPEATMRIVPIYLLTQASITPVCASTAAAAKDATRSNVALAEIRAMASSGEMGSEGRATCKRYARDRAIHRELFTRRSRSPGLYSRHETCHAPGCIARAGNASTCTGDAGRRGGPGEAARRALPPERESRALDSLRSEAL